MVAAAQTYGNQLAPIVAKLGPAGLPKVHHSWQLGVNFSDPTLRPILVDYAKITHAVSPTAMAWLPYEDALAAASVAREANATVDLNYSP